VEADNNMIDCHSHFYPLQFAEQELPTLAAAARDAGVQAIVVVPESLQDCHQVCRISIAAEQGSRIGSTASLAQGASALHCCTAAPPPPGSVSPHNPHSEPLQTHVILTNA
jgi:hypothetical protein